MKNRDSAHPGRIKLTPVDEANGIYDLTRADDPRDPGTPLNKKLLDYAVAACGVTAGTAAAYTLDDEFGGFDLVDGACVNFRLHVANSANPTLNVNGTGAKYIVDARGTGIGDGMPAGTWITARYSKVMDKYIAETSPRIISGTYVGDGMGKAVYGISFAGNQPSGFTLTSKTYREILLPFAPSVLYVYAPGKTGPLPIYQGGVVTADVYFLLSTWTSTNGYGNYRTIDSNTDILRLDGNILRLIGSAEATVVRQSSSEIIRTQISEEQYTGISQPPFSDVGGTNVAGITYSYIAF